MKNKIIVSGFLLSLLVACLEPHYDVRTAARKTGETACTKTKQCSTFLFALAWPDDATSDGMTRCVNAVVDDAVKTHGAEAKTSCSTSETEACLEATRGMTCNDFLSKKTPASCEGC